MGKQKLGAGSLVLGLYLVCASISAAAGDSIDDNELSPHTTATTIYYNAHVVTMNEADPTVQAIAIHGTKILAAGSKSQVFAYKRADTKTVDLNGATVLPGFIDSHSHLSAYALFSDPEHLVDVSSINIYFKPPASSSECKHRSHPADYQNCFIPVQTQDDVNARIARAVAAINPDSKLQIVVAINYDPARLGHSKKCPGPNTDAGFQCPNFENGKARQQLDALSSTIPILVFAQAGHAVFANTPALEKLNICGTDVSAPASCHVPAINPGPEMALAQRGQLNEDLTFFAVQFATEKVLGAYPSSLKKDFTRAVDLYAQHGFTLAQEGLTLSVEDVKLYLEAIRRNPDFPLTVGFLMNAFSDNFKETIVQANKAKALVKDNPNLFVAGVGELATDGSLQMYTGAQDAAYLNVFPPFDNAKLFKQPYKGIPDETEEQIKAQLIAAHDAGYPVTLHANGAKAISNSIAALQQLQGSKDHDRFRDVLLHVPHLSPSETQKLKAMNLPVTFLTADLYYWGLPLCQQIIGPKLATQPHALYPAGSAEKAELRVSLHTDTPVSPPDPLFEIWAARTRSVQQPSWYPNLDSKQCPSVMNPEQSLSIKQGIQAFTTNAAWQYGLEDELGMIKPGFVANLVFLSDDPLSMEDHPDQLENIQVLGTVHRGQYVVNPNASKPRIWPAN